MFVGALSTSLRRRRPAPENLRSRPKVALCACVAEVRPLDAHEGRAVVAVCVSRGAAVVVIDIEVFAEVVVVVWSCGVAGVVGVLDLVEDRVIC